MTLTPDEQSALAAVMSGMTIRPGTPYGRALEQLIVKGLVEIDPDTGKPRLVHPKA